MVWGSRACALLLLFVWLSGLPGASLSAQSSVRDQNLLLLLKNSDQLLERAEKRIESLEMLSAQQSSMLSQQLDELKALRDELKQARDSLTISQESLDRLEKKLAELETELELLFKSLRDKDNEILFWKVVSAAGPVAVLVVMLVIKR